MTSYRVFVPDTRELEVGEARVFKFRRGRSVLEGFVLRIEDGWVAYANECPHWRVDLDLGDGRFWDPPNGRILCRNHGALFHPRTGVCELGPCVGLALEAFELTPEGEGAWVTVPDGAAADGSDEAHA